MDYKKQLHDIAVNIRNLQVGLDAACNKLIEVSANIDNFEPSDSATTIVKLKYQKIKYDDTTTWEHISDLPHDVLHRWGQRMWLYSKHVFTYGKRDEFDELLGTKGRKSVEYWLWRQNDLLTSIMCEPSSFPLILANVIKEYHNGSVLSKKYMKLFFDMLDEEILKYESR